MTSGAKPETRVPVIIKDDYIVFFERFQGLTFVHCTVRRWTKSVRASLKHDFTHLCALHDQPIFAVHEIGDTKHEKFLALFGFRFLSRDGKRAVFVRDNDGN